MNPIVSAVVPFFDVADYIRPCLESIRVQTLTDFEVVLVDDGSTDSSAEQAREVVALDRRFSLVSQVNQGLGPARNTGAAHATGRYLMFVDSDDLLAPRAFEQLVTSLESSGSDFAAGHVWRLSLQRGLETSWAHRAPFRERLQRTSIREIPLLMRDRMAWNKLYRRSFWDERGYVFPAIRFEDFPVTLRSHLEAAAVDTVSDPVYVWRERPSGDSISQTRHRASVEDRVTAALDVLDCVDSLGTDEVRELVHSHLVDVDVREVMDSMLLGAPLDQPAIEWEATRLARRIEVDLTGLAHPRLAEAHRALVAGDAERARDIARGRHGDPRAQTSAGRRRSLPAKALGRGLALARRAAPAARPRRATLEDVRVSPRRFHYRLTVPFKPALAHLLRGEVVIGSARPSVRVSRLPTGVQLDVSVDTASLAPLTENAVKMVVRLEAGPLRWSGGVSVNPDQLHGARRAGVWVQSMARDHEMAFQARPRVAVIHRADMVESRIRLTLDVPDGTLVVERPWPTPALRVPVQEHRAVLDVHDVVGADPADDPVTHHAVRRILHYRAGGGPGGTSEGEPVVLSGPGITAIVDDPDRGQRRLVIRRDEGGWAVAAHEPAG